MISRTCWAHAELSTWNILNAYDRRGICLKELTLWKYNRDRIAAYCARGAKGRDSRTRSGRLSASTESRLRHRIPHQARGYISRQLWMTEQLMCFPSRRAAICTRELFTSACQRHCLHASNGSGSSTAIAWVAGGDGGKESLGLVGHKTGTSFSPGVVVSSFGTAQPVAQVPFCLLQWGKLSYIL